MHTLYNCDCMWQICVRYPIIVWIMISFDISTRDLPRRNAPKAAWSHWSVNVFPRELFYFTQNDFQFSITQKSPTKSTLREIVYEVNRDFGSKFSTVFNEIMIQTRSKHDSFAFLFSIMYFTFRNTYSWKIMLRISCVNIALVCPLDGKRETFYSNSSEKFTNSHFSALSARFAA